MAPTLSAQNLSVRIGKKTLLDSLTFTVQAGEHLGLIGPSGSGKSMFARTVMGLLPARANVSGSLQ
ncbi:ATP-binding cassette domain-containing protein, partial [Streptococcus agalactiae]|nr:ATP-binding cassette domain-containing protein [Streptococcus agalactiae]